MDRLYNAASLRGSGISFFTLQPGFIHQSQGNERAFSGTCRGAHNEGVSGVQMPPHLRDDFPYGKVNMKWVEWQIELFYQ